MGLGALKDVKFSGLDAVKQGSHVHLVVVDTEIEDLAGLGCVCYKWAGEKFNLVCKQLLGKADRSNNVSGRSCRRVKWRGQETELCHWLCCEQWKRARTLIRSGCEDRRNGKGAQHQHA